VWEVTKIVFSPGNTNLSVGCQLKIGVTIPPKSPAPTPISPPSNSAHHPLSGEKRCNDKMQRRVSARHQVGDFAFEGGVKGSFCEGALSGFTFGRFFLF